MILAVSVLLVTLAMAGRTREKDADNKHNADEVKGTYTDIMFACIILMGYKVASARACGGQVLCSYAQSI